MAKRSRLRRIDARKVTIGLREALEEYLAARKADGLRESTLRSQRGGISLLFRCYPESWEHPREGVRKYLSEDVGVGSR